MPILSKEKDPSVLEHQTDRGEKSITNSIPQFTESIHLAIEMEPTPMRDPLGIDSFFGNVRSFRARLRARSIFLVVGIIA